MSMQEKIRLIVRHTFTTTAAVIRPVHQRPNSHYIIVQCLLIPLFIRAETMQLKDNYIYCVLSL